MNTDGRKTTVSKVFHPCLSVFIRDQLRTLFGHARFPVTYPNIQISVSDARFRCPLTLAHAHDISIKTARLGAVSEGRNISPALVRDGIWHL